MKSKNTYEELFPNGEWLPVTRTQAYRILGASVVRKMASGDLPSEQTNMGITIRVRGA